jgi:hypothetical protein
MSFKNNCDSLSWIRVRYYDNANPGSTPVASVYYPKGGQMIAKHRGEKWSGKMCPVNDDDSFEQIFTLGHDYTGIMTIYQNEAESTENAYNTGAGRYDVYVGRGKIQADSKVTTEANIGKDILSIKAPVEYNGSLIGGAYLKIGDNKSLIKSYSKKTGIATLEKALSGSLVEGTEYEIITNYIECEPFTFYCRSEPEVKLTVNRYSDGLEVSGDYSQAEGVAMQWFRFKIMYNGKVIDDTGKQYTYSCKHVFPICDDSEVYTVVCEVSTQENFIKSFKQVVNNGSPHDDIITNVKATMKLVDGIYRNYVSWTSTDKFDEYQVFREDKSGNRVFIKSTKSTNLYDYTAGRGIEYKYLVCGFSNSSLIARGDSDYIKSSDGRCYLAKLTENGESLGRKAYKITSEFLFAVDCEEGEITSVISPTVYTTSDEKPVVCIGAENYEKGSFTTKLSTLSSGRIVDNYSEIERWKDFITTGGIYLYKNGKGDVKIISITSDPTRDYSSGSLMLTTVKYEYVEVADVTKVIITMA